MNSVRVVVKKIISSRYGQGMTRPLSWDDRVSGVEKIETTCGKTLSLFSDGQQSTPQVGWEILLNNDSVNEDGSVSWTLFGMPKGSGLPSC